MGGHFKNPFCIEVIVILATFVWQYSNSATRKNLQVASHRFVCLCLYMLYIRFGTSQLFRLQLDRVFPQLFNFFKGDLVLQLHYFHNGSVNKVMNHTTLCKMYLAITSVIFRMVACMV